MIRPGPFAAVCAVAAGMAACASTGGVRPRWSALPDAVALQTDRPPIQVIAALDSALRERGFVIARVAPREGYLETQWFDLATQAAAPPPFRNLARVIRLRFFVDPVQGHTRLVAESVARIAWDPSLPERDLERMVPVGHPGRVLLDSLLLPFAPDTTHRAGPPL